MTPLNTDPNTDRTPANMSGTTSSHIRREMTISHKDFMRTAANALGDLPYDMSERHISAGRDEKRLEIDLSAEGERDLGALELPVIWVDMKFSGYSEQEIEDFLVCWDQHFQTSGGP